MSDFLDQALANPTVTAVLSAIAIALVALWLAAAWWAYSDAARRTESTFAAFLAAGWVVLSSPLLLPLSLMVYGFARPPVTAADHRARALVTALGSTTMAGPACPACRAPVERDWLRCPECSTWLAAPCAACGEWSDPGLEICPWCGREGHDAPAVEIAAPAASTPFPRTRRARAARRPVGPGAARAHRLGHRTATADGRPLAPVRGRG